MATHSSTLAWKILWMEEPGRLLSIGSQRVGHDWATSLMVFPVVMYGYESWTIKKAECQRIDSSELWCWRRKTLGSPLDCKEIKPVNPKWNQSWIFVGRTDVEAETPILWPSDAKSWLIWKDPDAGKDWRQEEKGTTEDEMVGWHHRLDGHEFEQALGVDDGQGGLAYYSPWGCKESDTTEWLNWFEINIYNGTNDKVVCHSRIYISP